MIKLRVVWQVSNSILGMIMLRRLMFWLGLIRRWPVCVTHKMGIDSIYTGEDQNIKIPVEILQNPLHKLEI